MTKRICDKCKCEVKRFSGKVDSIVGGVPIFLKDNAVGNVGFDLKWEFQFDGGELCAHCVVTEVLDGVKEIALAQHTRVKEANHDR